MGHPRLRGRSQDYYLCPLSENQLSHEERRALLQPVWTSQQPLQPVYRPQAMPEQPPELVAEGFSVDVVVQAEVNGRLCSGRSGAGWCGRWPSPPARSRGGTNACNRPRSHGSSSTHASRARNAWVAEELHAAAQAILKQPRGGRLAGGSGGDNHPGAASPVLRRPPGANRAGARPSSGSVAAGRSHRAEPNGRWAGRSTRPITGR